MSKTIRRRPFRKRNYSFYLFTNVPGFKTNGYYTEYDLLRYDNPVSIHHGQYLAVYRPMTAQERFREYWVIHGESKNHNTWSPGPQYRQRYKQYHRTRENSELRRCLNDSDYDPVFYPDPPSCWRQWWWY